MVLSGLNHHTRKSEASSKMSYYPGVIINSLLEFNNAAPDTSLINNATAIATTTCPTKPFNDNKYIFTEAASDFDENVEESRGIFLRNLRLLQRYAPSGIYVSFGQRNADSIWVNARSSDGILGVMWQGGHASGSSSQISDFSSHSPALQCLVSAWDIMSSQSAVDILDVMTRDALKHSANV